MKKYRRPQKSIIVSSALYFILFTILLLVIYSFFQYRSNQKIAEAFITLDDILEYEQKLIEERYEEIPMKHAQNASFIVFDGKGNNRFASDKRIVNEIYFEDLELLDDYHTGRVYYVFEKEDADGNLQYWVSLSELSDDADPARLLKSCLLSEDLKILRGDLFPGREYLSQREFELLSGVLSNGSSVEKYSYQTSGGEERTLVFWTRGVTEGQYQKLLETSYVILAMGIPVILLAVLLFAYLFSRRIKRNIEPLNEIIASYESGNGDVETSENVVREFSHTVAVFRELIRQVEEERMEKEAVYAGRQKLIADISHDIKTPLTVIQGYAKALADHVIPREKEQRYLEAICRKSESATRMVNDLFLMARMEHPDYVLHKTETDFFEFAKEMLAERHMEISESGFFLEVDIPEEPCMVEMDRELMGRCFQNLLGNALKYNEAGTTLFFRLRREEGRCTMIVADDGIGIPEEIAGTVFELFVTGNHARTTGKGTGLGLSIVQRIVEMHRGKIELIVPPEQPYHTEFRLELPLLESGKKRVPEGV